MKKKLLAFIVPVALCAWAAGPLFAYDSMEMEADKSLISDFSLDGQDSPDQMLADFEALEMAMDGSYNSLEGLDHHDGKAACDAIGLDDAQKTEIMNAFFDKKKAIITEKANFKLTKIDYVRLVLNPAATIEEGQKLAASLVSSIQKMSTTCANFKTNLFFKTLKPEQRKNALICLMHIKKAKAAKKCQRYCNK